MPKPGDRIGPWVVETALGQGAMGSVFRCHHHEATRMIRAVKLLAEGAVPQARTRFMREAETLFSLRHPAVVSVVDVALDADPPYLVMELVEGESLESRLRKLKGFPIEKTCRMFRQLADGLAFAHGKGIRHRDIKPANIMIGDDGVARMVDFGLAIDEERTRLTEVGATFGTMSYMPPELFAGKADDDARRDVYALGVCLYESLVLKRAFPEPVGLPMHETWKKMHQNKEKKGPLDPGPRAPEALRELVRRATEPSPAKRMRDMIEFGAILDTVGSVADADKEQAVMMLQKELTNPGWLSPKPAVPARAKPSPAKKTPAKKTPAKPAKKAAWSPLAKQVLDPTPRHIEAWWLGLLLGTVVLMGIVAGVGMTWLWRY